MVSRLLLLSLAISALVSGGSLWGSPPHLDPSDVAATIRGLESDLGESHSRRIRSGVEQVADRWWEADGDAESFRKFCEQHFLTDTQEIDHAFMRIQEALEQVDGHLHEIRRELTRPLQLDTGTIRVADRLLGNIDLASHVGENLFQSKLAFLALLNFPVDDLEDRLEKSSTWNRRRWAQTRMMDRFAQRIPATVAQEITLAFTEADQYIADYNIRMDRLVDGKGNRPFPEGLRLITHWGLRDELKSRYADPDGLAKQRMILRVIERIVRQEIPEAAIDNPEVLWAPDTNKIWSYDAKTSAPGSVLEARREPDTRYDRFLDVFRAVRLADPYSPTAPTYIDRRFNIDREIPEKQVASLLASVLESKEFADLAGLIRTRLGRNLEPFDIWYNGFKSGGGMAESRLDEMVADRYPNVEAFQRDLPRILTGLGFSMEKSAWLANSIQVDPSRGAGHAMGAVRREDKAHLRTRFGKNGMDYKGYNIAVHELGHNVEQVFSLNSIDHWWLTGVPNTAFTEALAFVFQNRDLELLGISSDDGNAAHMEALDTLWGTAEIGGVALVDMGVWRWMYEHPDATSAELRQATLKIARDVWNRYFADVFGIRDQEILAVYSHMIAFGLYLPDYPLGHIIAFQVADKLRQGDFGGEFERVSRQGRLTPDAWMRGAVGTPVSAKALLAEAREAIAALAH